MKQTKLWLTTIAALLCSLTVSAYDFSVGGIYYDITDATNLTVEVTNSYYNEYSGAVNIPSTVTYNSKTYSVTSIGNDAFYDCSSLTSITIPEGVTSIGERAFYGCSSLTSITLPESVTSIGDGAFYGCSLLTSITLPESVTSIGSYAFDGCTSLKEVILEDGSETLSLGYNYYYSYGTGQGLFYDCPLETVYLGRNLSYNSGKSYGYSPFYNMTQLKTLTIGENVTSVGSYAFYNSSSLTSITIPEGVTSIGNYAFDGCTSLKEVILEDGSETLSLGYNYYYSYGTGQGLFYDCPLENVYMGRNLSYNISQSYGYSPFYNKTKLATLTIGNSVTSIGGYAFYNCSGLTSITLPESVTSIESYAFYNCSSLTSITIPEGVTSIGNYAFDGCTSLKEVIFEDGSETLSLGYNYYYSSGTTGQGLFYDCPLESVYMGRNLSYNSGKSYGYSPFYNKTQLKTLTIGDNVTSVGGYAFYGCSSLTSITLPEGVTSIGERTFYGCSGLTSITILEGVTSIGYQAFYGCSSLTSITIPEGVTSIGDYAFCGCSSLTSITIPEGVTSIGERTFYGCSSLTTITIPEGVTSIGDWTFYNCSSLTSITIPEGVTSIGSYAFDGCGGELTVNCNIPSASSNSYGAFYNSKFTKVTIGDNVTSVGSYAFYNCSSLYSVTIGSGVQSIGSNAFNYAPKKTLWLTNTPPTNYTNAKGSINYVANNQHTSLSNVKVYPYLSSMFEVDGVKYVPVSPSERTCHAIDCAYDSTATVINVGETASFKGVAMKVTEVMPYAFYGNDYIEEVSVSHLGNIGDYAFYDCDGIKSVDVHNQGSIGSLAFYGCNGMETAIIANVAGVGSEAFSGCSSLKTVTLGDSIGSLGNKAFYQCSSLQEIVIPNTVSSIGAYCFGYSSLSEISIPQSVMTMGNYAFQGCSKLSDVIIEDRTTALSLGSNGSSALFADCPLDSVYIGGKITYNTTSSKGYSPFYRNTSLRTVVITDREEQIYDNEFYGCSNLKNVTIGNGVKSIGGYAFSGCSSLDGFSFGSNMERIGTEAFSDCTNLTSITSHAAVPPTCGTQALDDINKWSCILSVPQNYATAYQAADQWKEFFFIEDVVEVERYVLTYVVDGEVYHTDTLVHKATIVQPEAPVKEGHTFSGWSEILETMPANDVTISGTFTVNKYLVTFKIGDEIIAADSLEYGAAIVAPEAPEKEGYTFNGWGEVAETVPANDLTYEGSYSVNSYLLTYTVDGETIQTDSVAYGTAITLLEEPTKEGYTFSGWSEAPETMPANDVTISGTFTVNKYLVTFKIGDEVIAADSLEYGAAIVAPEAPEKEGYTFNGWGEVAEIVPANDLTYEGNYSVNSYLLTYVVDGETLQADSVAYGTAITLLEGLTKEGYTFSGWSEAPETMPANDVTISGAFTVNKYLVTFKIGDEVIAADSLEYGATIVAPEVPEKEGYTFDGWGEVVETVPAGDVTCEGTYTVNIYKVYYYVGEELVHTAEIAYGETIPEYIYEPTKEGEIFNGWSGETYETMPAHDVTYTANIESGIEDTEIKIQNSEFIYDLTGRKVVDTESLKGGVYIVNGRKITIND